MADRCPTCGTPVNVVNDGGCTSYYERDWSVLESEGAVEAAAIALLAVDRGRAGYTMIDCTAAEQHAYRARARAALTALKHHLEGR